MAGTFSRTNCESLLLTPLPPLMGRHARIRGECRTKKEFFEPKLAESAPQNGRVCNDAEIGKRSPALFAPYNPRAYIACEEIARARALDTNHSSKRLALPASTTVRGSYLQV